MSAAFVAARTGRERFAALAADALRGVGWTQVRIAILYGAGITFFHAAIYSPHFWMTSDIQSVPLVLLQSAIGDQIAAFCLVLAVVVADRSVDAGARPRSAYAAAVLTACVLGYLLGHQPVSLAFAWWTGPTETPPGQPWLGGTAQYFFWPLFFLTQSLLVNASAVFLYADRRAARKTATRLRAAELDRTRRSRLAFESRLQAMQARIEPQFLFNTLAQVERLYEDDPVQAGRMLDALISYLRAAMPMMRDTSSTVGREIELARAYLDIVRLRLGERLSVAIEAPPGADDIRMPPMMLLPLIDHAIVCGLEPATGAGAIRIHTEVRDGRLRLTICDSGVGFAPETGGDGIAALRERLDALYGSSARLELRRADPRATEAVLDLPLESSAGADERDGAPSTGGTQ